jgi:hypothetical protein
MFRWSIPKERQSWIKPIQKPPITIGISTVVRSNQDVNIVESVFVLAQNVIPSLVMRIASE